ncbi:MAG: hypothetical protein IRZ16_23645, partial [Myxococcaceae bacterium]|nr:hypothetical protein [Myxococcaceae bacterium]
PWTGPSDAALAEPPAPAPTPAPPPAPPPPPPPARAPSPSPRSPDVATKKVVVKRPPPPEDNDVSLYGAPTLGAGRRGVAAYLGFPLLGIKAGIGAWDRLDVGLGFDSFYGVMNEPRAWVKLNAVKGQHWSLSIPLEAGAAFFTQRPETEQAGARWLTGRRNYNIELGMIVGYRGDGPRAARLFLDVRYLAALDTQPYSETPLGGVPAPIVWGHNVPIRMGAEMPFSPSTSFLFDFGFDLHGRAPRDSAFMPVASVGIVAGI